MQLVGSGHLCVFVFIRESLFLNSRHVDHVSVADGAQQIFRLGHVCSLFGQIGHDFSGHPEKIWAREDEFASKTRQGMAQRVNRATVPQVACQNDLQTVEASMRLPNREQIQHGLCGVVSRSISTVENGDLSSVLRILRCTLTWVAHGDDVGVAVDHLDGVVQGFTLHHGGGFDVPEVDHIAAEAFHGGFEGHACPGAGFEEQVSQYLPLQEGEIHFAFGHWKEALCVVQDAQNFVVG